MAKEDEMFFENLLRHQLPHYPPTCPGCQRRELHKMCPAWGTRYYMSGIPFTKELEEETREEREAAIERVRNGLSGNMTLD